jgi:hypothetical protein
LSGFGTDRDATETGSNIFFIATFAIPKALKAKKFSGLFAFWLSAFTRLRYTLSALARSLAPNLCRDRSAGDPLAITMFTIETTDFCLATRQPTVDSNRV